MSRPKMLYFGAGLDVAVINIFPEKDIVFIDAQPCSEFDGAYDVNFYRNDFMKRLLEKYGEIGFELVSEKMVSTIEPLEVLKEGVEKPDYFEPTMLTFKRDDDSGGERMSRYYISSAFPDRLSLELNEEIDGCSELILSGFFPHLSVISRMMVPLKLFCDDGSVYDSVDDDDDGTIVHKLVVDGEEFKRVVRELYCYSSDDQVIVKCDDFDEVCDICKRSFDAFVRQMEKE